MLHIRKFSISINSSVCFAR